jgi:hypothetical protein
MLVHPTDTDFAKSIMMELSDEGCEALTPEVLGQKVALKALGAC